MDSISRHPEETGYFEDALPAKDGQMPVMNWLESDRPWTGLHDSALEAQPSQAMPDYMTGHNTTLPPFMDYRSTGDPSEIETIPGDSGYGSYALASIENTSVYGDDTFRSHDVDEDLRSFHLNLQDSPPISSPYDSQNVQAVPTRPTQGSEGSMVCDGCGETVRTRSELKKHELRHNKPFTCPVPACNRHIHGFASQNDVVRHQMTVHKKHDLGKTYMCHHDPCVKKDMKPWPRADNFRSHLWRVHRIKADDDISEYLYARKPTHPIADDLSGVGTNLQDPLGPSGAQSLIPGRQVTDGSIREFPEIPTPDPSAPYLLSAAQEVLYDDRLLMPPPRSRSSGRFIQASGLGRTQSVSHQLGDDISTSGSGSNPSDLGQAAHGKLMPPGPAQMEPRALDSGYGQSDRCQELSDTETESNSSTNKDSDTESNIGTQQGAIQGGSTISASPSMSLDHPGIREYLRNFPKHLLEQALADKTQGSERAESECTQGPSQVSAKCPSCSKVFPRPCELRKHVKRHERPYGCTSYGCNKKFGSKNDWKRHETGQHKESDFLYCESACGRNFEHSDGSATHLRAHHQTPNEAVVQKNVESSRRGSHCTGSFWCGFCRELIPVRPDAHLVDERFNHIDDHFMGRNAFSKRSIEDWHYPEESLADHRGSGAEAGRKRKSSRQGTGRPTKQVHT